MACNGGARAGQRERGNALGEVRERRVLQVEIIPPLRSMRELEDVALAVVGRQQEVLVVLARQRSAS